MFTTTANIRAFENCPMCQRFLITPRRLDCIPPVACNGCGAKLWLQNTPQGMWYYDVSVVSPTIRDIAAIIAPIMKTSQKNALLNLPWIDELIRYPSDYIEICHALSEIHLLALNESLNTMNFNAFFLPQAFCPLSSIIECILEIRSCKGKKWHKNLLLENRKQRLYACACCRCIWDLLRDVRSRQAVQVSERFADNLSSAQELKDAREAAESAVRDLIEADIVVREARNPRTFAMSSASRRGYAWAARAAAESASLETPEEAVPSAVSAGLEIGMRNGSSAWIDKRIGAKSREQLAREIFVFLPPSRTRLNPAWLTWNDAIIPRLARTIYDEQAFDRLPLLADALEEAGCIDTDILSHCRQPGEHVRGCWVVDLILEREGKEEEEDGGHSS